MAEWLAWQRPAFELSPPDWQGVEKGHGRLEIRQLWMVACTPAMQAYLQQTFGWPGVQWCGWLRRQRHTAGRTTHSLQLWIAGAAFDWSLSAAQAAAYLRGHWRIENRVFYVRDVSMQEDRLHGRSSGPSLSSLRNIALNLLRTLGSDYLPDARRYVAALPDLGFHLLC